MGSVVTRFTNSSITQFFVQDGRKINTPVPAIAGLPPHDGLSAEMCSAAPSLFGERNRHAETGGWAATTKLLTKPLVLSLEMDVDVCAAAPVCGTSKGETLTVAAV